MIFTFLCSSQISGYNFNIYMNIFIYILTEVQCIHARNILTMWSNFKKCYLDIVKTLLIGIFG